MKYDPLKIVLFAFLPLIVRTALYFTALKIRSIHISLIKCIVLAGSALLITIVPIPLPYFMVKILSVGLAMFLMTRYTEAEIYPDVILISIIVEALSTLIIDYIITPLF